MKKTGTQPGHGRHERLTSQSLDHMDYEPFSGMPLSRAMQWWVSRNEPGRLPSPRKTRAASNRTGPG
jgi:hypothetical protein